MKYRDSETEPCFSSVGYKPSEKGVHKMLFLYYTRIYIHPTPSPKKKVRAGRKWVASLWRISSSLHVNYNRQQPIISNSSIILSVLLRYMDSDCPFGIFKLFSLDVVVFGPLQGKNFRAHPKCVCFLVTILVPVHSSLSVVPFYLHDKLQSNLYIKATQWNLKMCPL